MNLSSLPLVFVSSNFRPNSLMTHRQDPNCLDQSAAAVEYTEFISAEEWDSANACPDMTLNNLMVRFQ